MINRKNFYAFFKYLIVAICSAIVSYFTTSCSTLWIKGNDNNPVIEASPKVSADSTSFIRVGNDSAS